jgi:Protein of unknown function (DUF935)
MSETTQPDPLAFYTHAATDFVAGGTPEPYGSWWITFTPDLLLQAELLCNVGNFALAADLCEQIMADERVLSALDTRIDTMLSLPLTFESSGDGRRKSKVVKALEAEDDWSKIASDWKEFHRWGLMMNIAVGERVWIRDPDTGREIPRLVVKHPRWLRYNWLTRRWVLQIAISNGGMSYQEIDINPNAPDSNWVMWCPRGYHRPWIYGLYRAISRYALLKKYGIENMGFFADRHGNGTTVALNVAGSKDDRESVRTKLSKMGRNGVIVLQPVGKDGPIGSAPDIKLLEATSQSWQVFPSAVKLADQGFSIAITGIDATVVKSNTGGGNDLHKDVAAGRIKVDADSSSTFLQEQFLRPWASVNYGDPELAPYPHRNVTPSEDVKEEATTTQMRAQAASSLVQTGCFTKNEVRAVMNLPSVEGGDELLPGVEGGDELLPGPGSDGDQSDPNAGVDMEAMLAEIEAAINGKAPEEEGLSADDEALVSTDGED